LWEDVDETERTKPLSTIDDSPYPPWLDGNLKIPVLTVVGGRSLGRVIKVEGCDVVLGRGSDVQVVIADKGISRNHSKIFCRDDELWIIDLGSTNGTFVNDERIKQPVVLKQGDYVRIGLTTILRFGYHDKFDEKIREKLYDLATRDPLTNAYNRRYFEERFTMEWAWARRHNKPCALLAIDVDHFKGINDTHGHAAGDSVLVHLVACLREVIRTEDTLARVGGEEFLVLGRATDTQAARVLAERIRNAVEHRAFAYKDLALTLTVSLGVCISDEPEVAELEQMIRRADHALYRAKEAGRNQACFASDPIVPSRLNLVFAASKHFGNIFVPRRVARKCGAQSSSFVARCRNEKSRGGH